VEQQLSRRILSILDCLPSHELPVTQEILANLLGVRREAITAASSSLEQAGVIRHTRGHITVIDRASLQARACECYAVVKREYERLLPTLQ
jgi:DNA-binding transcriptional regulator YhcF (GntR family)